MCSLRGSLMTFLTSFVGLLFQASSSPHCPWGFPVPWASLFGSLSSVLRLGNLPRHILPHPCLSGARCQVEQLGTPSFSCSVLSQPTCCYFQSQNEHSCPHSCPTYPAGVRAASHVHLELKLLPESHPGSQQQSAGGKPEFVDSSLLEPA